MKEYFYSAMVLVISTAVVILPPIVLGTEMKPPHMILYGVVVWLVGKIPVVEQKVYLPNPPLG